jgi:hypothetical protein
MGKYCRYCGTEQTEGNEFCPNCGARVNDGESGGTSYGSATESYEVLSALDDTISKRSPAFAVLSFVFPLLGLILWAVWKDSRIGRSESCARGALAALAFMEPVFGVIYFFVMRRHRPDFAKSCLIAAIVSGGASIIFSFLLTIATILGTLVEEGGGAVDEGIYMSIVSFLRGFMG